MGSLGFPELIIIFVVALLVFGPKKLPELGKSLGKGLREFKRATDDLKSNWEDQIKDAESSISEVKETVNSATNDIKKDFKDLDADFKAEAEGDAAQTKTSAVATEEKK